MPNSSPRSSVSHCYFSELFPRKSLRACWGDITLPPERWSPHNNKTKQCRIKLQSQREEISSEKTGGLTCRCDGWDLWRWPSNDPFLPDSVTVMHFTIWKLLLLASNAFPLPAKMEILLKKQVVVSWPPLPYVCARYMHYIPFSLFAHKSHTIFTASPSVETSWQPAELHISENEKWWHQSRLREWQEGSLLGARPLCQASYVCYFNDLPNNDSSERWDIIHYIEA